MVKVIRAGTVLFVEESKLDFYLQHGYEVLESENTPKHLTPPIYNESVPAVEPVIAESVEEIAKPEKVTKPKNKRTKKAK